MTRAKALIGHFIADQRGATAIEYSLIALLVAVAAVGAFTTLGSKIASSITATAAGFN